MRDPVEQFRDAMVRAGITPPDHIKGDGRVHRVSSNGKPGDLAGWYVLHLDGLPAGAVGDWRTGHSETWRADPGRKLTPAEQAQHRARMAKIKQEREAEEDRIHAEAAQRAVQIWESAKPATDHPYLTAKGISGRGLRVYGDKVVVPVRDADRLQSLQFIGPGGEKKFLPDGKVAGGYWPLGQPAGVLCISEGVATGDSIHEATGHAVAAALNAGNLLAVARKMREKFPDYDIVICADNDTRTPGNPGLTKATEAAREIGARLAVPPDGDFNDLFLAEGPDAVRAIVDKVHVPMVLPEIVVHAGDLAGTVDATAQALIQSGAPIYRRGSELVRTARVTADEAGPVQRSAGAVVLRAVDSDWLQVELARVATYRRMDQREKKLVPTNPTGALASLLIARADDYPFPELRSVVRHPILTLDGRIVTTPGYDEETSLLLDFSGTWPIPTNPTKSDAEAAARVLLRHLRHYPFTGEADAAVALSLMCTALMRPLLPSAPLHGIDATEAGSGKSLLADVAAICATGQRAAVLDYGNDPAEAGKRLDAALLAGDPIIVLDNIEVPLEGSALCQTLTQTRRQVRVLGQSKVVTVPCTSMIVATGNNLAMRGDMARRATVLRLDPGTDRPELRSFDQDLIAETLRNRQALVAAALAIPLAYIRAGRPDVGLTPLGSFDDWSRTVRAALVWAGAGDPCATAERIREADPGRQALTAVFGIWSRRYGPKGATASQGVRDAGHDDELCAALTDVCLSGGGLNVRSLGNWFRRREGTRSGDLVLRKRQGKGDIAIWSVVSAGGSTGSSCSTPYPLEQICQKESEVEVTYQGREAVSRAARPSRPTLISQAASLTGVSPEEIDKHIFFTEGADHVSLEWLVEQVGMLIDGGFVSRGGV